MDITCAKCTSSSSNNKKASRSSLLSAFLVILLPKCPFCVMAYTSALTICGGSDMYYTQNNWVSYIPLVLCVVIVVMIAVNNRGIRTRWALMAALSGSILILLTHQLVISASYYAVGASLLLIAIWMNGSFLSFVFRLKGFVERKKITWLQ